MNFDKNKINEIIENFVSTKVLDKGITSNTITAYKKDLNLFTNWCLNNKISIIEVEKKDINFYIFFLKEKNLNQLNTYQLLEKLLNLKILIHFHLLIYQLIKLPLNNCFW